MNDDEREFVTELTETIKEALELAIDLKLENIALREHVEKLQEELELEQKKCLHKWEAAGFNLAGNAYYECTVCGEYK